MHPHLLHDIGLCVIAATVMAYVARVARQPLILAYIGAGLIVGPPGFQWVRDQETIAQISELGLAFLLFIVGLEIDLKHLAKSGKVATVVGTVQVVVCAAMGWGVARALGYHGLPAVYLGAATAFSSTMIVVKLLSDRSELDTTSGRIVLGVLLVQDVLAIVVLAVQPNITHPEFGILAIATVKGLGLAAGALLVSRFVLPGLFRSVAKFPEIVLVSAISWCFLVSYAAQRAGFSVAMGALIAGVSISAFPYSLDVVAKIRSLRDFFVTLFFVSLGMQITSGSRSVYIAAAALSAVVVFGRFIPIMPTLRVLRYGHRVGILTSIALGQVSEFSLVIVSLGLAFGHIDRDLSSVVTLALVATSTLSTYFIQASQPFARGVAHFLERCGLRDPAAAGELNTQRHGGKVILLGCHRVGSSLIPMLIEKRTEILVVDFSPEILDTLRRQHIPCMYGDISRADTLEHAGIAEAEVLISTVSDDFLRGISNFALLRQLRRMNPTAKIIVSAERLETARSMYAAGADFVLLPRLEAATRVAQLVTGDEGTIAAAREKEIEWLRDRQETHV
ncbi:MAG: cation:proton antiporter [Planctomycetes bacterium]|nr:cation:proton antiporter [Planctomycetota bacterium]